MELPPSGQVTQLLSAWKEGDASALDRLVPLLYRELHDIARRQLRNEHAAETLQATGLVHEAYLRLAGSKLDVEGRRHFLSIAASTMRRVLVDHARSRGRAKRGGGMIAMSLAEHAGAGPNGADIEPLDLLAIDMALEKLAAADARKARVVELHYFGGLDQREISAVLGVSIATVERDLRFARGWIYEQLRES